MNLKRETILDFYTHKKKKIFCQIKVQPSKCHTIKYTCRSLTQEQWNAFDTELEKLLDGMISSEDAYSELMGKFMIGPNIEVKVQKSKMSPKYLCKCLCTIGDNEKDFWGKIDDTNDVVYALECLLVMEHESILNAPEEIQEYEPQLETSPDGKLTTSLTYEPYTPSKRKYYADGKATINTPATHLLNDSEDTYSPMPLFETSTIESLNEVIPQYKPAPIKENGNSKNSGVDNKGDVFVQKSKEEYIPEGQKITTFDIPAYVPTPIDWSQTSKALKAFHENPNANFVNKNLRMRSKTIDAIPKDLVSNMFCKQKIEYSVTQSKEKLVGKRENYDQIQEREIDDKNSANEVIFETDDETVSGQKYRPSKLKSKKKHRKEKEIFENNLKTHDLPEIVPDNYNKKCRKRCKTLDSIPRALAVENEQLKLNLIPEENNITKSTNSSPHKLKEKKIETNQTNTVKCGKEGKLDKDCTKVALLGEDENISEKSKKLLKAKETHLNGSDNDFEDEKNVYKIKNVNTSSSSITDDSPPKTMRNKEKSKELYPSDIPIRRSGRSPSKPIRYIEEIGTDTSSNRQKKRKTHKSSHKNKELFGTDDDDDDDDYFEDNGDSNKHINIIKTASVCETPLKQKSSSSSSSSPLSKKKRKRDKNSDCEQEKRDISKWLSKNKNSALNLEASTSKVSKKPSRSKSPSTKSSKMSKYSKERTKEKEIQPESTTSTPGHFNMPSKEELEEIRNKTKLTQKKNEKFKAELDKMKALPPREVENLSLQDMSLSDILHTFSTYKNDLDEIYQKYYKRDYINGHDGINHCFVIRLLQQNVQLKMLEKLTDVYSDGKNTTQATLYANALLPEWVIRVYMEKFNFTRQEAINQIKAQDDYRLHMEQENDVSFMFD
ncbi:hypothetical protein DOY81_006322 [Sarcophaga bullata]|nr:hypothetical protein DOY81_006322 [Sarcophaga bullata]